MRRVIIESPFTGDRLLNEWYGRAAMLDCLNRGEAPFASHLLYTQAGVLDDDVPLQREQGIVAGLVWGAVAEVTVVYTDLGITPGMKIGIDAAQAAGRPVEYRQVMDKTDTINWLQACKAFDNARRAGRTHGMYQDPDCGLRIWWYGPTGGFAQVDQPRIRIDAVPSEGFQIDRP